MSKEKDYIENIPDAERRYFTAPVTIETRAEDGEGSTIEGYAALFNSTTNIGSWYAEEIAAGAFDEVLKDDVRCLFNHDPNQILARSQDGKGTLTLSVDSKGLKYSYVTPDRSYARDLEDAISKGDVSQSSFAFSVKESTWIEAEEGSGELDKRIIKRFGKLYDVAPVTYPAYQDTSVAKRSYDAFKAKDIEVETEEDNVNKENSRAEKLDVFEAQYLHNKNKLKS